MEKFRCETFFIKEPETIEWIKGFYPNSIFIDVGANIGAYSLYAASLYPEMKIFSFEPLKPNHQSLLENIILNQFGNIIPLNQAVSDHEGEELFLIKDYQPGSSGSQLMRPLTEEGEPFTPLGEQIVKCITIDDFVERIGHHVSYLKIDINGQEWQVLKGAEKTIRRSIRSLQIELNPLFIPLHEVHDWMLQRGFILDVELQSLENHSNKRSKDGPLNFTYTRSR